MSDHDIPTVKVARADSASGFAIINADAFDPARHERYIEPPPAVVAPPPPVIAPPPGPLDGLPAEWRTARLNVLQPFVRAATGRTAENARQAVEMIEAALAGK